MWQSRKWLTAMPKRVLMLYQDCYDCDESGWYERQVSKAEQVGIVIEPTPHNFPGAKGLIIKGNARGCGRLPFFTDGKKYAYDVSQLAGKKLRNTAESETEVDNGAVSEAK